VIAIGGRYSLLVDGGRWYAWVEDHALITRTSLRRLADALVETGRPKPAMMPRFACALRSAARCRDGLATSSACYGPGVSGCFNCVKVFSATMFADRDRLGDRVTEWIARNPACELTDLIVTQSSDASFHCITITVFYRS
jgi:hypothetical protein